MNARVALPPPCPPVQPPDCFNPVAKMALCYDLSKDWTAFIEQIVIDVLKEIDPGAFQWPVLGLTDGSISAAPGYVGELITRQFTGNFTNVANTGTSFGSLFSIAVPAGCWELSYQLQIFGGQVLTTYCRLDPNLGASVPQNIPGNLQSYTIATAAQFSGPSPMPGIAAMCPPTPFANTSPQLLAFRVNAYSGIGTTVPSAPYQFNGYARRVR